MYKYILIYLWIYSGIFYGATEAADADEHVHIKLHMPKTGGGGGGRKPIHHHHHHHRNHHHKRQKKNPPPLHSSLHGHAHISSLPPPSSEYLDESELVHSQIYHETPQNYLTAAGGQPLTISSSLPYLHDGHLLKKRPSTIVDDSDDGHHHNHHHHQLMDGEFYTHDEDGVTMALGIKGDHNGNGAAVGTEEDFMLNEYLTSKFSAFPQPTEMAAEIVSPQITGGGSGGIGELAYHHHHHQQQQQNHHNAPRIRDAERQLQQNHGYYGHQHHHEHSHYGADQDLEEDNEILGHQGQINTNSALLGQNGWSAIPHSRPFNGEVEGGAMSSVKSMKNGHFLNHIMQPQQQQRKTRQEDKELNHHPDFPFASEIANTVAATAPVNTMLQSSSISSNIKSKYRDDKLPKALRSTSHYQGDRDQIMEAMHAYEDMDLAMAYSDTVRTGGGGGGGGKGEYKGAGDASGIKPLTVDDIWSQLQRTYLNKYTPQAQPVRDQKEDDQPASRKRKRNSHSTGKTGKHNYSSHSTRSEAIRVASFGDDTNYTPHYTQEYPLTRLSSYSGTKANGGTKELENPYAASYTPYYSSSSITFGPTLKHKDLYETQATVATRPSYHNSAFDEETNANEGFGVEDETASEDLDEDSRNSEEDTAPDHTTVYSSNRQNYEQPRSHRNNLGIGVYNTIHHPFEDLYASHSTPVSSTLATYEQVPVSTYHPNSFSITRPIAYNLPHNDSSPLTEKGSSSTPESTSYQWREQQHYPSTSYQAYQQYNHKRPQQQKLIQYQPQVSNILRLPKASAVGSTPTTATNQNLAPLTSSSAASYTANEFTPGVKPTSLTHTRYKKRKNRLKTKRN
ncbi:uncharacterized protein LOC142220802 [Haematobia irritans]|uniref:uncharacterized protein LOC142220802 n=1 Tax=Haematobia irritans TaxID=7368 RepID=UPI003F4F44F9